MRLIFRYLFLMFMRLFVFVYCMDPVQDVKLWKLDYGNMNDQQRMEVMIRDVNNKNDFLDEDGEYKDVCKWKGVECDSNSNVVKIYWYNDLNVKGGSIDLEYIPPNVTEFIVMSQSLNGTINVSFLPHRLLLFDMFENKLSGQLHLHNLPNHINEFFVGYNNLEGTIDLTMLPSSLEILGLNKNNFTDPINLIHLPMNLKSLWIYDNKIKQVVVVIGVISNTLEEIYLYGNSIDRLLDIEGNLVDDDRIKNY